MPQTYTNLSFRLSVFSNQLIYMNKFFCLIRHAKNRCFVNSKAFILIENMSLYINDKKL
jgi:hypothetical protein